MKKLLLVAAALQMSGLMAGEVYIKGLDKAALVQALYNNIKRGEPAPLSKEQAESISKGYIDRINERYMKIDVSGNWVDTWLYNEKYGSGVAEEVIEKLRNQNQE